MLIKNHKKGDKLLKIKEKSSLIKICKVISWLDDKRWNDENNYNFINFFRDDLRNCEKILKVKQNSRVKARLFSIVVKQKN